jgi:hypothetical protein
MKKSLLKSFYQLQVLNDGSSLYNWVHPFNRTSLLKHKDITSHYFWNKTKNALNANKATSNKSYTEKYTKSFRRK